MLKVNPKCEITSLFQNENRNVILKTGRRFGQKYLLITFRENVSLTLQKNTNYSLGNRTHNEVQNLYKIAFSSFFILDFNVLLILINKN